MKINSKSRTYKFTQFYNFDHPNNLCQYTRQIMGATILTIAFGFVLLYILLIAMYPVFYAFAPTGSVGLAMVGILLDGVIFLVGYKVLRSYYHIPDVEITTIKPDSVLSARIKSLHDKVCPLIKIE